MADRLHIVGSGVDPQQLANLEGNFSTTQADYNRARERALSSLEACYRHVGELITDKILKVVSMDVGRFTYYAGREVTEGLMGVMAVGVKQHYYVDPAELQGKHVLGVGAKLEEMQDALFGGDLDRWKLDPGIEIAFEGTTYTGPLHSVELEVLGDADEAFVAEHQQQELAEVHNW